MTQTNKQLHPTPKQASRRRAPIDRLLDPEVFKALGDPTRTQLFACLAKCGRGCSVSEIAECRAVDFSVVSRHLAILARAGVVESTKQGRTVIYRARYAELGDRLRALADAIEGCCPNTGGGRCC